MKKIVLWTIVGLVIAAVAGAGIWWLNRPQVIVLKDGSKLTLLGITYGKHNVPPKIKLNGTSRRGNVRVDSTNDVAVVWIEAQTKPNNWPNFQLIVSDPANTAAVTSWSRTQTQVRNGIELMGFQLDSLPRRSSKIILRIFNFGPRGQQLAKGRFTVSNPVRGSFSEWSPDPLPDDQSDGDLDVTLTNLDANAFSPYSRYNGVPRNDPLNKIVQLGFAIEQKGQPATNWRPYQVTASDATGNSAQGWINENYQGAAPSYFFESILWPNEPAWKLRFEFTRTSGFNADELWTISNIPVKQGTQQDANMFWDYSQSKKTPFAQTDINGIHLKAYSAVEYDNQMNSGDRMGNKVVSVAFNTDPDVESAGMRITPLSITDDQGHPLQNWGSSWGSGNYGFQYRTSRTVQFVNITVAVHKSRFVEFTVKPTK